MACKGGCVFLRLRIQSPCMAPYTAYIPEIMNNQIH
jgi:hypothetical protein